MARGTFSTSNYLVGTISALNAPITVSCWMKLSSGSGDRDPCGLGASGNTHYAVLQVNGSGNSLWSLAGVSAFGFTTGTSNVVTGNWVHLLGVSSSTANHKVYVNGSQEGSTSTTNVGAMTLNRAAVGVLYYNTSPLQGFPGYVAEYGVWNVALSDAEIAALAKGYSPMMIRPQSLQHYWPLGGIYSNSSSGEFGIRGGTTLSETGTVGTTDHPPKIIYPSSYTIRTRLPIVITDNQPSKVFDLYRRMPIYRR